MLLTDPPLALCWSTTKCVSVWKSWDLDDILSLTYSWYSSSNQQSFSFQDMPEQVQLNQVISQAEKLSHERSVLTLLFNTDFLEVSLRSAEERGETAYYQLIAVIQQLSSLKTCTLLQF